MKVYINTAGTVCAKAENLTDMRTLLSLAEAKTPPVKAERKKHKKHNFKKKCEYCGKGYKGLQGLGIHQAKCTSRSKLDFTYDEALNNPISLGTGPELKANQKT